MTVLTSETPLRNGLRNSHKCTCYAFLPHRLPFYYDIKVVNYILTKGLAATALI
jgi:hypothetical protein